MRIFICLAALLCAAVAADEDGTALQGRFVFAEGRLWLQMSGGGLAILFR